MMNKDEFMEKLFSIKNERIADICRQEEEKVDVLLSNLQAKWLEDCENGIIPIEDWDNPELDVSERDFSAHQIRYLRELGYRIMKWDGGRASIVPEEREG